MQQNCSQEGEESHYITWRQKSRRLLRVCQSNVLRVALLTSTGFALATRSRKEQRLLDIEDEMHTGKKWAFARQAILS